MAQFLQLEKTDSCTINATENVLFDENPIAEGDGKIIYDGATGVITFLETGVYHFNWFVTQQNSQATNGSNFSIKTTAFDIIGSNNIKISQTSSFAIVKVTAINETARLVNVSDAAAILSNAVLVKASLAVFKFADIESPVPEEVKPGYFHAQVSNGPIILQDDEIIDFDNIISRDSKDIITKNLSDNGIVLAVPGIYMVSWEVPVESTNQTAFAEISLSLNGSVYSRSHMPLPVGVLSGNAIIVTNSEDEKIYLSNTSGDEVQITDKTNFVVTQLCITTV